MRIAFFSEVFLPKVDGVVTRLRNTISQLRKAGDEVLIFAPDGGIDQFEGARVIGMPAGRFPLYPELRLALPRRSMGKTLIDFRPDVIHAVEPVLLGVAGIYYADTRHIPLVVSYHTDLPRYLHYYGLGVFEGLVWQGMRRRHNSAAINLCTSSTTAEKLNAHGIERVMVWQRGIDTDLFHPSRATAEMRAYLSGGHPDSPLLLYVGRLSPEKNVEQLRSFLNGVPGARLALAGGGPHREALVKHFKGTPTFFAGYLEGERLASAFASADTFVLPSHTETLGLVALEAMAAGCPVVAARAGGIPDLIEDGVSGFLFDEESEGIEAVKLLLLDSPRRNQVRGAARVEAESWSWTAATDQLRNFYSQVQPTKGKASIHSASNSHMTRLAKLAAMGAIRRALP
jgi:glycosyltransferase involved in cell wall biosynthesis